MRESFKAQPSLFVFSAVLDHPSLHRLDEDGFIHRQTVTPGNVHDSREHDTLLLGDESQLYADAAYRSKQTRDKLAQFGTADRMQRKGYHDRPLSVADHQRNKEIAVTRSGGMAWPARGSWGWQEPYILWSGSNGEQYPQGH